MSSINVCFLDVPSAAAREGRETRRRGRRRAAAAWLFGITLFFAAGVPLCAQLWLEEGPAPIDPGPNTETVEPNTAVGAMHVLAPHPTRAGTLYAGSVNGGIWKTTNATSTHPRWRELTDDEESLSISALEFDPTDVTKLKLLAGIGCYSSFGLFARQTGLLRTTNGGITWQAIDGGGTLTNACISGVAARGSTLLASVAFSFPTSTLGTIGVFRSTDGGATFVRVSVGNGAATGLPSGRYFDLVGDPTDPDRLFTGSVFSNLEGGSNGIYRTDDRGASWTKVSSPAVDAFLVSGATSNVELAVGRHDNVFVAIANFGRLAAVFRSGDGGGTWQQLDLPGTVEDGGFFFGIHPGGQAFLHMSIAADPTDPNVVYVGGDRQPGFTEGSGNPAVPFFPNSIGAISFSGRLFRGDASLAPGSQWTPLTHTGTASSSAPHADSRELAFAANGDLFESDDGGVYRRTSPRSAAGDWFSTNGNLQVTELHDLTFDSVADILFGGAQDNATPMQYEEGGDEYFFVVGGDGGDTAADDFSTPGVSTRLASAQGLQGFLRTTWDADNDLLTAVFPPLTLVGGGSPLVGQFVTPFEINAVDASRVVFGGANSVYESLDQGDTIAEVGPGIPVNGTDFDPIAYGGPGNPDILYVGSLDQVYVRTAAAPAPLVASATFPGVGELVADIVLDPADPNIAYVATTSGVYRTGDAGGTWTVLTGDLAAEGAVPPFFSIEYIPGQLPFGIDPDLLAIGSLDGVYGTNAKDGFSDWSRVGGNAPIVRLPTVPAYDLDYDVAGKTLYVGTLGRGVFRLRVLPFVGFVVEQEAAGD